MTALIVAAMNSRAVGPESRERATARGTFEWDGDVVLADGATVHMRAMQPDDAPRIQRMYERLSADSLYYRFFSPVPRTTATALEMTSLGELGHEAIVALLGDEIVAAARYDLVSPGVAEIAFVVADEHQGRGVGTLLLEHLAVVARSDGIRTFEADTLPDNSKMLGLFASVGWARESHFDGGNVRTRFSIEPSAAATAAISDREHVAEAASMARLLAPRTVAVIGASREPGKIGYAVMQNLVGQSFTGVIYPVNPNTPSVAGLPAYASVLDIPDAVDLAVVIRPAADVLEVVDECAAQARARAGDPVVRVRGARRRRRRAPTHDRGERASQRHARRRSELPGGREHGPRGAAERDVRADASRGRQRRVSLPVGRARHRAAEPSRGAGDRDLRVRVGGQQERRERERSPPVLGGRCPHGRDPALSRVVREPAEVRRGSRCRISRHKPIVVVKSGRTPAGSRAASSHTAALASSDIAVDALFRQAGVIRVDTLEELLDTAQMLASQPIPNGPRVAIIGNAGGPGILAADACAGAGLRVEELSAEIQSALRAIATPGAAVGNPIDLGAAASPEQFALALPLVLADDEIDAVIIVYAPPVVTDANAVARSIADALERVATDKPVVVCFLGRLDVADDLRGDGASRRTIPTFAFPEAAARSLGRVAELAAWRARPVGAVPELADVDAGPARDLISGRLQGDPGGGWLDEADAEQVLHGFGIPTIDARRVLDAAGAVAAADEIGYPVVLKVGSPTVVHKTDVGGVALGLNDRDAVLESFAAMEKRFGDEMDGAVVQRMAPGGLEVIVGVTQDPLFGPLLLFGLGGVTAELLADRALRILPVTDEDAHELVRSLRTSPLLFGYRGSPPLDVDALEDLIVRVARLAQDIPEITEMDLNPIIVHEHAVVVVDAKVRYAPAPRQTPPELRRMRG